ncbi:Transcription factor, K-box [Corchorus olitorius]|uniref:Transcription factor, K-box n=1 Tax=Corchorus olitorius TaxID=93759 RepID=A0A1R3I8I0_9ROSI|nr:Transcription factor, K-box [Corchorus olitorius]
MGDSLSSLTVKELKQLENRLERGITRIRSKKEIELENESVCLRTKRYSWVGADPVLRPLSKTRLDPPNKIAEVERLQQANMVTGPELNAIQALASRNFFSPNVIDGGTAYSSHPDKKILHLG